MTGDAGVCAGAVGDLLEFLGRELILDHGRGGGEGVAVYVVDIVLKERV